MLEYTDLGFSLLVNADLRGIITDRYNVGLHGIEDYTP
jgi:hypothetical protein